MPAENLSAHERLAWINARLFDATEQIHRIVREIDVISTEAADFLTDAGGDLSACRPKLSRAISRIEHERC